LFLIKSRPEEAVEKTYTILSWGKGIWVKNTEGRRGKSETSPAGSEEKCEKAKTGRRNLKRERRSVKLT